MTLPSKAKYDSHCSCLPRTGAPARRRTPVERQSYGNLVAVGNPEHLREGRPVLEQAARRRCAGAREDRSTVLSGGRVASWEQVRISGARRQIRAGALMRPKISGLGTGEFPSANSQSSRSLARQSNTWSSAATATAARRCDGCPARVRRQVVLSAQLLPTSCLGFNECRSESNQRQSRQSRQNVPVVDGLRVGEPTRIGRLSWPALGRISNVSERGVTAGETALNSWAPSHEKRWRDASGGLPRTDPETSTSPGCRMGGVARNRDVTARRDGIEIPAAGYAALGRGPRNPRSLITGSGAGLAISRERMQRKHRATRPVDRCGFRSTLVAAVGVSRRNVEQGGWTTAEQELAAQSFSSGDGLGIQQPGSNTRGFALLRQPPSGRARNRAMCPAVARSNEGRAA